MNILCVVAHPDDELIGCGATVRRLASEGHDVYTCVLASTADARHARPELDHMNAMVAKAEQIVGIKRSRKLDFRNIQFNAVPHLEMVKAIEQSILEFKPEWVFTHSPGDLNIDHRVCYETTMAAVMLPQRMSHDLPPAMIRKVFLFEILSSTDWAPPTDAGFRPNSFFDVKATFDDKIRALDAFEGALKPYPHSRSKENLRHLAHLRGAQVGIEMAEAFCLVRDVNL